MTGRLHNSTTFAAAVLVLLVALLLLGFLAVTPARAATGAGGADPDDRAVTGALPPQKSVGNIVETGQDITVPLGTSANSVFALGGSITVAGSVREVVAGIGADVRLPPTARVGTAAGSGDTSLVVVGGDLTSAPGATVFGKTTTEPLTSVRDAFTTGFWRPIASPLAGLSLIGWAALTVLLVLLGLLVAAVLPRQTRASMRRVAAHPASSLGWGALTAFVIVPLATVALVITIVGILLSAPRGAHRRAGGVRLRVHRHGDVHRRSSAARRRVPGVEPAAGGHRRHLRDAAGAPDPGMPARSSSPPSGSSALERRSPPSSRGGGAASSSPPCRPKRRAARSGSCARPERSAPVRARWAASPLARAFSPSSAALQTVATVTWLAPPVKRIS